MVKVLVFLAGTEKKNINISTYDLFQKRLIIIPMFGQKSGSDDGPGLGMSLTHVASF